MSVALTAVMLSDAHWRGGKPTGPWKTARSIIRDAAPDVTMATGDLANMGQIARWDPVSEDSPLVATDVDQTVENVNGLPGQVVVQPGNHCARWARFLGLSRVQLRGLAGLDLEAQFRTRGLDKRVRWVEEGPGTPGVWVNAGGPYVARHPKTLDSVLFRHGDLQASSWGAKDLTGKMLREGPHFSEAVGHHHVVGLRASTSMGRTIWKVANGHLTTPEFYARGGDVAWQAGITLFHWYRVGSIAEVRVEPVYIAPNGGAVWRGKFYP